MIILKNHENLMKTGGYTIFKKRTKTQWVYVQYWGVYGNEEIKINEEKAKEKEWI